MAEILENSFNQWDTLFSPIALFYRGGKLAQIISDYTDTPIFLCLLCKQEYVIMK